jgi:DNA-binding CsgD family transcriptional regulator
MQASARYDIYSHDPVGFLTDRISAVNTSEEFELLLRTDYRISIPFRMALCGLGEIKSGLIYELINVDTPDDYLSVVINHQSNGDVLNCPAMREWSKKRETVFLEQPHLIDPTNKKWLAALDRNNIQNAVIGGFTDISGNHTSAFCFMGIPELGRDSSLRLIDLTIGALHRALVNLYQKNRALEEPIKKLKITRRELEILHWIYHGLSNEGIASKAKISINTVRCHVKNITLKLGVTNRTQALAKALREGLVRR